MRLGTKIIITGFILFAVGVVWIEITVQNLSGIVFTIIIGMVSIGFVVWRIRK